MHRTQRLTRSFSLIHSFTYSLLTHSLTHSPDSPSLMDKISWATFTILEVSSFNWHVKLSRSADRHESDKRSNSLVFKCVHSCSCSTWAAFFVRFQCEQDPAKRHRPEMTSNELVRFNKDCIHLITEKQNKKAHFCGCKNRQQTE